MTEKKEETHAEKKSEKKEVLKKAKPAKEKEEIKKEKKIEAVPKTEAHVKEDSPKKPKKESEEDDERQGKQTELVETDKNLNTGAHIGTKFKSGDMKRYIYKVRKDGLNVLDVQTLDERLKFASKFLSGFPANRIAIVSRKVYAQAPAKVFADSIGASMLSGRFVPGTFTNPESTRFFQPAVVFVADTEADMQAIKEATRIRVPVVAMVSTNNSLRNVDIAIPINNKGKKRLALGFWILAKEILKHRGEIKDDAGFSKQPDDFEYKMKEMDEEEKRTFKPKKWQSFGSDRNGGRGRGGSSGGSGGRSGGSGNSRGGGREGRGNRRR